MLNLGPRMNGQTPERALIGVFVLVCQFVRPSGCVVVYTEHVVTPRTRSSWKGPVINWSGGFTEVTPSQENILKI